jgi:hypothetical protein
LQGRQQPLSRAPADAEPVHDIYDGEAGTGAPEFQQKSDELLGRAISHRRIMKARAGWSKRNALACVRI